MMQDAKAKKFERVVVKDVSRFARNTVDLLQSIRELKLITSEIKEKDILGKEFTKTIKIVDDILNNETITNAMLKTIIDVIEVDDDSNVEVRLKLLNEMGTTPTVITNFADINNTADNTNSTVTESNIGTRRTSRTHFH